MYNIEYEIILDQNNRPIVGMSDENISKTENIFCILELAKFYIENSLLNINQNMNKDELNISSSIIRFFEDVTEEMSNVTLDYMKLNGEIDMLNNKDYHIKVDTIEKLEKINKPVVYDSKIYNITPKLKALVLENNSIYNYIDTQDNKSIWKCITNNQGE